MFKLNLRKEVTFEFDKIIPDVDYVLMKYSFCKGSEPKASTDYFIFKDGKFVYDVGRFGIDNEFLILMGLLEGGMEALEDHINKCYKENKLEPLTLKTKNKFLDEEDKHYLTDEELKKIVHSDVLASIIKKYYNNFVCEEDTVGWEIDTITREEFPYSSDENKNDIHFALDVLHTEFTKRHSMFIKYKNDKPIFNLVLMPQGFNQVVAIYVEGGDSFGNWINATPITNN